MLIQDHDPDIRSGITIDPAFMRFATSSEFVFGVLAQMHDGLLVTDTRGARVVVNRALCKMTGFSASDLMGATRPCPCWPEDQGDQFGELLTRVKQGDTAPAEVSFQRKNGERFPVTLRPAEVRDAQGKTFAWLCVIRDCSKRTAASPSSAEQRWRAMAENPFDFVSIIDRDYIHRFMNHTDPELEMSEVLGVATPFDFTAPEFHQAMRHAYDASFSTGRSSSYESYSSRTGRWYSTVVGAIHGAGEVRELALLSRDITESKEVERAHRRSERRLALALEGVNDGLLELSLRTNTLAYSSRAYQLLGFADGDPRLSTSGDGLKARMHPDEREAVSTLLDAALHSGVAFSQECRLRTSDETYRWFQVRGRTVEEEDGETRFVAFMTDTTARREAEEQRRTMAAELERAQRLETIGTLAGGVAHDFNNLLTPIMGALELAAPALPEGHSARPIVSLALDAALRAKRLTQQILTFARRGDANLESVNLIELAEDELRERSGKSNLPIDTSFPSESPVVLGDRTQLRQILANLLTNAQQAMEGATGRLQLRVDRITLDQAERFGDVLVKAGPYVRVTVSDQGVGMSSSVQNRAFDPFFTTKPFGRGSGLGLAVVHGAVARHGGHLRVRSESREGSTFEVYLPELTVEKKPEASARATHPSGYIVCVDDEPAVLAVTKRALELADYKVMTTTHATEALQWVGDDKAQTESPINLLVTDYRMPQLTGLDLAKRVRTLRPQLPIILVTGFADDLPKTGNPPHVSAVVQKPFRISELIRCVEDCLARTPWMASERAQR